MNISRLPCPVPDGSLHQITAPVRQPPLQGSLLPVPGKYFLLSPHEAWGSHCSPLLLPPLCCALLLVSTYPASSLPIVLLLISPQIIPSQVFYLFSTLVAIQVNVCFFHN